MKKEKEGTVMNSQTLFAQYIEQSAENLSAESSENSYHCSYYDHYSDRHEDYNDGDEHHDARIRED